MAIDPSANYFFDMDAPQGPATAPPPPTTHQVWRRAAVWMVVALFVSINAFLFLKSCRDLPGETLDKTGKVIDKAGKALSNIAGAFRQRQVTTAFISYATSITHHQR